MEKSDYLIRFKVDGEVYEIDELDLGDAEMLQESYGRDDLTNFNLKEPKCLAGLIHVAIKHSHRELTFDQVRERVVKVNPMKFEKLDDQPPADSPDPTPAARAANGAGNAETATGGASGNPPSDAGAPSTEPAAA